MQARAAKAAGAPLASKADNAMSFTPEELERYSRQILVRNFGGQAQSRLQAAHIGIIGAGGIGAPLLLYLAGAGVGQITLFEHDQITLSNLHRQIIYRSDQIGQPKAAIAQASIASLNPYLKFQTQPRFEGALPPNLTLLIDGSDNLTTRQAANRAAAQSQIPLLAASLAQWEGQIAHYAPASKPGCYECLYPEGTDPASIPSCSEAGVIGPLAGTIGTMAALEALKLITGIEPLPPANIYLYDGLYRETRSWRITPRPNCPVCGEKAL